ncbi:MAG: hypothetical protein CTY15_13210 [Methylocystis sp.]|nr:MAG: hypothetical protein CTY15_13210 [Methylocystis sp.]
MAPHFDKLFSIEIDPALAAKATARFADETKIKIIEGNSAKMLPTVLAELEEPALFWLDGHYSGGVTGGGDTEVPIMEELKLIFDHAVKSHVILIDDARLFRGTLGYPTISRLAKFVRKHAPHYGVTVYADIIRIYNTEYVWSSEEK